MALLDSISLFTNCTINAQWANGKIGEIRPTKLGTYIFVECEVVNGICQKKYTLEEEEAKAPVLAYGFVSFWLRSRKRSTQFAERLDSIFTTEKQGRKPKEIFDAYIESRKQWFLETISNRPDSWKYPEPEKIFYEQNLTTAVEKELILKSAPLLDFLDEEDKDEYYDVMGNFLEYVDYVVKPYLQVKHEDKPAPADPSKIVILEQYKASVESVFIERYEVDGVEYPSYPEIKKAAQMCIDPNEPPSIPIFIEACVSRHCARIIARQQPKKVVEALVGLGALTVSDEQSLERMVDGVGRKFGRLSNSDMNEKENVIYEEAFRMLGRPKGSSIVDQM